MDENKLVLTLGRDAAGTARQMAQDMGVSVPELVRRSLTVMQFVQSLPEGEELVVRDRSDGSLERVRFVWGL